MAVVLVEPLWDGRWSKFAVDGNRSYGAKLRVVTDSVLDGQVTVQFAPGVPQIGRGHYVSSEGVHDYQAVCTRADAAQDGASGYHWVVDCEFDTRGVSLDPGAFGTGDGGGYRPGGGGAADDPTLEPPRWRFGWESKTKPFRFQLKDRTAFPPSYTGVPCVNSAGEYFDPLPELEDGYLVLTYSRLEATLDEERLLKYKMAMNRDDFKPLRRVYPPYSAQCLPIEVEPEHKGGARLFRHHYKFRLGVGENFTWNPVLVQQGFKVRKAFPPGWTSNWWTPSTSGPSSPSRSPCS
jgi:hypothetical protein